MILKEHLIILCSTLVIMLFLRVPSLFFSSLYFEHFFNSFSLRSQGWCLPLIKPDLQQLQWLREWSSCSHVPLKQWHLLQYLFPKWITYWKDDKMLQTSVLTMNYLEFKLILINLNTEHEQKENTSWHAHCRVQEKQLCKWNIHSEITHSICFWFTLEREKDIVL